MIFYIVGITMVMTSAIAMVQFYETSNCDSLRMRYTMELVNVLTITSKKYSQTSVCHVPLSIQVTNTKYITKSSNDFSYQLILPGKIYHGPKAAE